MDFPIVVTWSSKSVIKVSAESFDEAKKFVEKYGAPGNGDYVPDSFKIDERESTDLSLKQHLKSLGVA
jgi:hypothetical protein